MFDTGVWPIYGHWHLEKVWAQVLQKFLKIRTSSLEIDKIVTKFYSCCLGAIYNLFLSKNFKSYDIT